MPAETFWDWTLYDLVRDTRFIAGAVVLGLVLAAIIYWRI